MSRIVSIMLLSLVMVSACGGSEPEPLAPAPSAAAVPESPVTPSSAAASVASTAAASESPRAKDATKWLKDLQDPEIDLAQRGMVAANGLSEEQFGLPAQLRKGMEAISSQSVDPSQSARIIAATLGEAPMSELMTKQCGKPIADVMAAAQKVKPAEQAKLVVQQCKLDALIDGADLVKLSFTSVLLSAVVQKLLEADPAHSEAEIGLAKLIANHRRLDAK
jgi:hypothetical protein